MKRGLLADRTEKRIVSIGKETTHDVIRFFRHPGPKCSSDFAENRDQHAQRDSATNASWQVQWTAVASRYPELAGQSPSRGTVSNARKRLPLALWERLCAYVSEMAQAWGEAFAYWRGHRVVLPWE